MNGGGTTQLITLSPNFVCVLLFTWVHTNILYNGDVWA